MCLYKQVFLEQKALSKLIFMTDGRLQGRTSIKSQIKWFLDLIFYELKVYFLLERQMSLHLLSGYQTVTTYRHIYHNAHSGLQNIPNELKIIFYIKICARLTTLTQATSPRTRTRRLRARRRWPNDWRVPSTTSKRMMRNIMNHNIKAGT